MSKKVLFIILFLCVLQIFSQTKTCVTDDVGDNNKMFNLNSINKCAIKDVKTASPDQSKNKRIAVTVSSRRRVVRTRNTVNDISSKEYTHKINALKNTSNIAKSLNLASPVKFIHFDAVDEIPLFKKCKSVAIYEQKKCFKEELSSHINKNIKYPEDAYDSAIQGEVLVYFIINKDGSIGQLKITPPHKGELLAIETKRIMKQLPNFTPAKHNGNNVTVQYGFPIIFKIPGTRKSNEILNLKEVYKFNEIETIPQFKSCSKANNTSLKCYNTNLVEHIQENFTYPKVALENGIEGVVNVTFVIDKKGKIINIVTKGPEDGETLEIAARVIIEKLPKFKPGIKKGKSVHVKYSFPITFKLD